MFRGFLPEGTIKLWFDSVWMGVTGGAMVGATSRRIAIHATMMRINRERVLPKGSTGQGLNKRFDSVWMGVTGGAMVGATSRGGGG